MVYGIIKWLALKNKKVQIAKLFYTEETQMRKRDKEREREREREKDERYEKSLRQLVSCLWHVRS